MRFILFIALIFSACSNEIIVANVNDKAKLHSDKLLSEEDAKKMQNLIFNNAKTLKNNCLKKDANSCELLASMFFEGFELKKDVKKALKYYNLACEYKSVNACNNLINFYKNGYKFKDNIIEKSQEKVLYYENKLKEYYD